ncbi:transcriptional adapter 2B-like [Sipha flava]|uniref:Transcriptional adapter 2B-like n=1 Tax=Sipha flava TaxID=143950 RepID=A0A8B8FDW3_9HEMI|nr:transcriptional adapter 2B-like [Sipha flava]XP_025408928.1 transcriptional adapter 2B-like [Sipha flava]
MDNTCTYCQDVIDSLTVVCLECSYFQLCLGCFSHGAEIGDHKNSHGYKLKGQKSPGQYLVSNDGWTGDDLMHILDFVEQYSFGCWDELPKSIINRTPAEIKLQFAKYFLDGIIGKLTWGTIKKPRLEDRTVHFKLNESITHLSGLSKAQYAEIGFNPIRDEFELENDFDNNAEAVLSIISEWNDFGDDYNLACVDMYCTRLYERTLAKEIVHDYQLMDKYFFSKDKPKRRLTQEEKSILGIENQLKKFTRYLTEVELWSLNIRLKQEYLLKKRREELLYYRKNGITKLYDIVKFNLLHYSMVVDEQSEQSSSDVLTPAPVIKRGEKRRKKRKRPKLFHKKNHVYHRTPQYIAALNRVLSQNNDTEDNSD